jgi:hypothetical protein
MARAKWSKSDLPGAAKLCAIFVAIGAAFGFLRGDGIAVGSVAGILLFGLVIGVGTLAELINRRGR